VLVSQLKTNPHPTREIQLESLGGKLEAIAVSEGSDVLLGLESGTDTTLYFVSASDQPRLLSVAGPAVALAFARHGQDAVIADRDMNDVSLVRDIAAGGTRIDHWSSRDGIDEPVAVTVDGATHLLVAALSGAIADIDIETAKTMVTPCGCRPTHFEALQTDSVFRLTDATADSPLYVYDRSRESPRVLLIPPFRKVSNDLNRR
jgi:hypothetical protein